MAEKTTEELRDENARLRLEYAALQYREREDRDRRDLEEENRKLQNNIERLRRSSHD